MLARRLPTILPRMSLDEALETTKIHSVAGTLPLGESLVARRPFRAPHHTISVSGLIVSIRWTSELAPRVATVSACVSPRVNSPEP